MAVFKCDVCNSKFSTKGTLNHHLKSIHNNETFKCTDCDKQFNTKGYLTCHISNVHNKINHKCVHCDREYYSKQAMNTFFYLEDQTAAKALKELDKKIEMPDGYPLQITTERSTPPNMPLTEELLDTIKKVMSAR